MKEAFGGTFLMYILMITIVVFVTFMAETLKYVRAFKVKNTIINYIEEYEGFNDNSKQEIENYLDNIGYRASNFPNSNRNFSYSTNIPRNSSSNRYCDKRRGYCVKMEYKSRAGTIAYYKVTTYMTLNFTSVIGVNGLFIEVPGETRYVTLS